VHFFPNSYGDTIQNICLEEDTSFFQNVSLRNSKNYGSKASNKKIFLEVIGLHKGNGNLY
jgi:hypothetical protein